jgi:hypothetical protein
MDQTALIVQPLGVSQNAQIRPSTTTGDFQDGEDAKGLAGDFDT